MAGLLEDIKTSRDWIVMALNASGYAVSDEIESVRELDRFFDDTIDDENRRPKAGGILAQNTGAILFAAGAYVGEVAIRLHGGEWVVDDGDSRGEINIEVKLPGGLRFWPVQRMMKRVGEGRMNAIYPYVAAVEDHK